MVPSNFMVIIIIFIIHFFNFNNNNNWMKYDFYWSTKFNYKNILTEITSDNEHDTYGDTHYRGKL